MDDLEYVGRPRRRRWELGVIAVLLVTLVGAVVWARSNDGAATQRVTPAALPDPLPVTVAQITIGTKTLFVKNVQGLVVGAKVAGTGLTFVRGLTSDPYFSDWTKQMRNSGVVAARRNLVISLLDSSLTPVRRFNVTGAAPVSLTIAPIDGTNQVMETLRLGYLDLAPA